jgi:hypothetical protein
MLSSSVPDREDDDTAGSFFVGSYGMEEAASVDLSHAAMPQDAGRQGTGTRRAPARSKAAKRPSGRGTAGGGDEAEAGVTADDDLFAKIELSELPPPASARKPRSALSSAIDTEHSPGGLPPLRPVRPSPVRGVFGGGANDDLNLQLEVLVPGAAASRARGEGGAVTVGLNVFGKCTVLQVVAMALRKCEEGGGARRLGSVEQYDLYFQNSEGEFDDNLPALHRTQRIGQHNHLKFVLQRTAPAGDGSGSDDGSGGGADEATTPSTPVSGTRSRQPEASSADELQSPQSRPLLCPPAMPSPLPSQGGVSASDIRCLVCDEHIDFDHVNTDKVGNLDKRMDWHGKWKQRWFQLYGNHLVYWSEHHSAVDIRKARGVIHLTPDMETNPPAHVIRTGAGSVPANAHPMVGERPAAGVAGRRESGGELASPTIQVGSIKSGSSGGTGLLSTCDELEDGTSESVAAGALAAGRGVQQQTAASPSRSTVMALVASPRSAVPANGGANAGQLEFQVYLPQSRGPGKPYHLRASTRYERDSWVLALDKARRGLYRTCTHCWKNVDCMCPGVGRVLCEGYLHVDMGVRGKDWKRRWMVCLANKDHIHVTYYKSEHDPGKRSADGCIHLYEGEIMSFHCSGYETRKTGRDAYTVYKINVKTAGSDRQQPNKQLVYKRWSHCQTLHSEIMKEFREKWAKHIGLPQKYRATTEPSRLRKRERQLNHYFAELTGAAVCH